MSSLSVVALSKIHVLHGVRGKSCTRISSRQVAPAPYARLCCAFVGRKITDLSSKACKRRNMWELTVESNFPPCSYDPKQHAPDPRERIPAYCALPHHQRQSRFHSEVSTRFFPAFWKHWQGMKRAKEMVRSQAAFHRLPCSAHAST